MSSKEEREFWISWVERKIEDGKTNKGRILPNFAFELLIAQLPQSL